MKKASILLAAALMLPCGILSAAIEMSPLFSDGMILQREAAVPVWGKALPGAEITVSFAGQSKSVKVAPDGSWTLKLEALKASKNPAEMQISGDGELRIKNVLVGEVWLCSGQSNMEMALKKTERGAEEAASASNPCLRAFTMTKNWSFTPTKNYKGRWAEASAKTVPDWSALAYYYGKKLNKELDLPVGLIFSYWSGTTAQAWTPLDALSSVPLLAKFELEYKKNLEKYSPESDKKDNLSPALRAAFAAESSKRFPDPGNMGEKLGWQNPAESTVDWTPVDVPPGWLEDRNIYGSVWFRKDIEIPSAWAGKKLKLNLDVMDDFDVSYFNGVKVGETGKETDSWWLTPRHYNVPEGLAKAGKNTIAVRIFNDYGFGGFTGEASSMTLENEAGETIPLAGVWYRKIELAIKSFPPVKASPANTPSVLYNGMINPLLPYAIKGVVWYQGESNAGAAKEYKVLLPTLIKAWREKWNQGDFPFYIVQLANFMQQKERPGESALAELREAQASALSLPKTGLAVTIDIGEADDIHYRNKRDAGERLALLPLALDYGLKIEYSGPVMKSCVKEKNAVRVSFNHAEKGLSVKGDSLKGFVLGFADGTLVFADAKLEGSTVFVSSPLVKDPVSIRYGWADNPGSNLYNSEGLPALPFRTELLH